MTQQATPDRRSLVIDTDTASDDAVALLLAARHPQTSIRAVTVTAGNVPVDLGVRNALITLHMVGADAIPVHRGCEAPLLRALPEAQLVHGADGMSEAARVEPIRAANPGHAVAFLLDLVEREPNLHDLVTLGPLTNIAAALFIDADLLRKFRHTWMMLGAADGHGNASPTGEFNAWADPEAAARVIGAPGQKTAVGWDVSRTYAVMTVEEDRRLRELGPLGAFASRINQAGLEFASTVRGVRGYDLPDPVTMAVALDPTLITASEALHLAVSNDDATRGQTYADRRPPLPTPNTRVVTAVDEAGFKKLFFGLLASEVPA